MFGKAPKPTFYFIGNKGSDGYLVPEMREADYFIMIKNYIDDDDLENMISALNKIPEIVAAVKIDPKKIKSRENLLF
jgi:thioredoxin-related protein